MTARAIPETLLRPEVRSLKAYHVADAGGLIKLDAMENPYRWPEELVEDWLASLREVSLNRYPDPQAGALKEHLREVMEIPAPLILGNGSDELIQLVMLAVATPGRVVLAPEPTFVMYRLIAAFTGMDYVGVPLRQADFELDLPAMREAIERHHPTLVFLASPNNPTGNRFAESAVREIVAAAPGLVVVDEAYFAFTDDHFLAALAEFDNLLVMRTVSKLGLAGLRLGLLTGASCWLDELEKVRLPYNVNVLTQASAGFALRHWPVLEDQVRRIRADREALFAGLNALPGITAYPSEANFVLFRMPPGTAQRVFEELREAGILIKNLSAGGGLLRDCLRVTVGRPEENGLFLSKLAGVLERRFDSD